MHHIISDGTSMDILVKEIIDLYQGEELAELKIQYKDFAVWQNELLKSEKIQKQEKYWLNQFADEARYNSIPVLEIPTDYPRPAVTSFAGDCISRVIEKDLTEQIKNLAQDAEGTIYMVLLAAYNILLSRYSGQEDIVVGSPIAGRRHVDLENIIGMFINTLAIRNYPVAEKRCADFLEDVKERALKAYENQDYQFDMLVEKLDLKRDMSRNPLFDVMFVLQNTLEDQEIVVDDLKFKPYSPTKQMIKFDLNLHATEAKGEIRLDFRYSTDLFQKGTIERMSKHFVNILKEIIENPEIELHEIQMISEREKNQLLHEFNQTQTAYIKEKTIVELFEEQIIKTPDKIALVDNDLQLTYQRLNQKANQLARNLRTKGVSTDTFVGIVIETSFEMFIGIFAVLKAGGAYLPVDPDFPQERIDFILNDSDAKLVLTSPKVKGSIEGEYEILDLTDQTLYTGDDHNLEKISNTKNLVYIIYTSGTTGRPKGVQLTHKGLVNYTSWFSRQANLTEYDKGILLSSFCFDLSYTTIYPLLLNGGKLYLISKETYSNPTKLLTYLEKNEITYIKTTPSHFSMLVNVFEFLEGNHFDSIRLVVLGGEEINPVDIEKFHKNYPDTMFMNHYGPTEATIGCIFKQIDFAELESFKKRPVIGKPIDNMKVHILNEYLDLLPVGVIGEIHIAGPGLARGYLNHDQLTAEKFIPTPFTSENERILYKTGDLGRYLPDGSIEFRGRKDNQFKIRGYRVEVGEIEKVLLNHDSISEVVVKVKKTENQEKYLAAYLVASESLIVSELRAFMLQKVPLYMVPAYFIQLDAMPLTLNGKIDQKSLPEIDGNIGIESEYIPPVDETEEKIIKIWQRILKVEKIGANYNFFDLGGNSLNATTIVSLLHQEMNVELPLSEFFSKPTVRELAEYIRNAKKSSFNIIPVIEKKEYYPVSSAQKRLFILNQLESIKTTYNTPVVMKIEGNLNVEQLESAFKKLIQRHESLRTSFETIEGQIVQRIHKDIDFKIDYQNSEIEEIEEIALNLIKPFDLSIAPLFRVMVVKLPFVKEEMKKRYLLVFDMHHIITDEVSKNILSKEVMNLYQGKELDKLRVQYKDFTIWQNELFKSDKIKKQEEYWLKQYADEARCNTIPVLDMPTDYPKLAVKNFVGDRIILKIDKELTEQLKVIANETNATLYMVLLAIYNILLSKYSNQKDIIIGSPIAGRQHPDLDNIIGILINTLAMRNYPEDKKSFREFLIEVKERSLKAYENQDYQFEMLIEKLDLKKNMGNNPLFDVMFFHQNVDNTSMVIEDLKFMSYSLNFKTAKFDLLLITAETDDEIDCILEYRTQLYKRDTIKRLGKHFISIIKEITNNPKVKLAEIEMITKEEKQQVLYQFNDTKVDYPKDKTIHQLFEEQVEKTPDKVAIVFGDKELTYKELNAKSNQLARDLRNRGS